MQLVIFLMMLTALPLQPLASTQKGLTLVQPGKTYNGLAHHNHTVTHNPSIRRLQQASYLATNDTTTDSNDGIISSVFALDDGTPEPQPEPIPEAKPETPPSEPKPPAQLSYEPQMVSISGGTYQMGSPASENGRFDNERQHSVSIEGFQLSKYETTFDEYDTFARDTDRELPSDRGWGRGSRPVINVPLYDANAYAEWLSKKTGKRYRLPTEAEWEYAARAGSTGAYHWGDAIGRNIANCDGCGSQWDGKQTAPVGQFAANAWGLHDMHGNVWEWTCSAYSEAYEGEETRCLEADSDYDRVLRGGSWVSEPHSVRAASRKYYWPVYSDLVIGFRLAQDN